MVPARPSLDAIIAPLLFSYAGDAERETLRTSGLDPRSLYPAETVYEGLAGRGMRSAAVQHRAITDTTFSRATLRGAAVHPFDEGAGWVAAIAAALRAGPAPAYVFAYVDDVDWTGHHAGPASEAHVAAATGVLDALAELARALPADGETLLLVTADHGQVPVDPATTVFVNELWPGITTHLRHGRDGRPWLPPAPPATSSSTSTAGTPTRWSRTFEGCWANGRWCGPRRSSSRTGSSATRGRACASGSATSSSSHGPARRSGGGSPVGSRWPSTATTAGSRPRRC